MKTSLHPLSPEQTKIPLDIFQRILQYTNASTPDLTSIQQVLSYCVDTEELRDEFFCQLIKQSTDTPTVAMERRFWELMVFACSSFRPSKWLLSYVASYVYTVMHSITDPELRKLTKFALEKLERTAALVKPRKEVPSLLELNSLSVCSQIVFLDGTTKAVYIDSASTAFEVKNTLIQKLGMKDSRGFEIFVHNKITKSNGKNVFLERYLLKDEILADVLSKYETQVKEATSKDSSIKISFQLTFKCRLFLNPRVIFDDAVTNNLLYHQAVKDITESKLPVTIQQAVQLAAFVLQIERENYDKQKSGILTDIIKNCVPPALFSKKNPVDWEKEIIEEWIQLNGKSVEEVRHIYLSFVKKLPFYGTTSFHVHHKDHKEMKLIVAVNVLGIHILDSLSEKRHQTFPFSQLESCKYTEKSLTIYFNQKLGKDPIHLTSVQASEIANLIIDYRMFLKQQSEYAKALQDHIITDPILLSFKKGDIIKIINRKDDEWFEGKCNGKQGMFPVDIVQLLLSIPEEEEDFLTPQDFEKYQEAMDTGTYKMDQYATIRFRSTINKKKELKRKLEYSEDPIKQSLVELNEKLNLKAIEIFLSILQDIMKFMEDYPKKDEKEGQLVQSIIQPAIDEPTLRDEVFCQLIKQTTKHPKVDRALHCWYLISLCIGCFLPSNEFLPYLKNYFSETAPKDNEIRKLASYSLYLLENRAIFIKRRYAPSSEEISSLRKRINHSTHKPILCRVFTLDGVSKGIYIEPSTSVGEIVEEIYSRLKLEDDEGWVLCEATLGKDRVLELDENLCDLMARWELENSISPPKFLWKKKYFNNPKRIPTNPEAFELIYHQAVHDVLLGLLPVSEEEALKLGVLQLQATHGDYSPDKRTIESNTLFKYLPRKMLASGTSKWMERFSEEHKLLMGKSQKEAKTNYLQLISKNAFYGAGRFACEQPRNPNQVWVIISVEGFMVTSLDNPTEVIEQWKFGEISSWSSNEYSFVLNAGDLYSPIRRIYHCKQIKQLTKSFQVAYENSKSITSVVRESKNRRPF